MVKLIELELQKFIDEVDSSSPAPGGGSVSALVATLGVALARMVGHLTIGKKAFQALDASTQALYQEKFAELSELKTELIPLIDRDTEAFNRIMAAYKMAKDDPMRQRAIDEATIGAIEVPFAVAKLAFKALKTVQAILSYGNVNALSDNGVAVLLLYSGIEGAIFNVKINATKENPQHVPYLASAEAILNEAKQIKNELLEAVHNKLS